MDRFPGYQSLLSRIKHKKAQVKSQLPIEHCHLVDEFAVYVLEQINKCLDVSTTAAQVYDHLTSTGTMAPAPTIDIQIENEQTNPTNAPSTTVDNHNLEAKSGSICSEQSVQPVPPPPSVTQSSILANIKVKVEDVSSEQSVQFSECVKKEEDEDGEYVMECDCEECEICRVKMEMKEELDESGETELGVNSGLAVQGCTRVKKEEEDGDGERPNKIQRIDRVIGNVPVGSPSPNVISINVEYVDDQVATSSTNLITIEDHTKPSQPVTIPLYNQIITPTQSSSSAQHVNDPLRDELLNGEPMMDNVVDVGAGEFDREQIGDENSTLNRRYIEHDYEEDDENEGDVPIEQREDLSAGDGQQEPAENFVKRIEADDLGNRFECDYRGCGRRMKQQWNLILHIRTHTGEKPFKCSVAGCDRAFVQKCHLDVHLNTHSGTRPFVCTWPRCEARFGSKSNLTAHLRTHTGERPFECGQCDATFTQIAHLTTHLRTHTESRPFVCTWPDCGQGFISSSHLHSHFRVHSNERHVCDVTGCTKVYKHKDALRRHQKAKHN